MLPTTFEATRAVLKADPTVAPQERSRILILIRNHGANDGQKSGGATAVKDRILRRSEVADRFDRTTRAIDKWARQGLLTRVKLPGRKRAVGFRESEVEALMRGEMGNEG